MLRRNFLKCMAAAPVLKTIPIMPIAKPRRAGFYGYTTIGTGVIDEKALELLASALCEPLRKPVISNQDVESIFQTVEI